MDMSFAIQAKCLEFLALHGEGLAPKVYQVPREIDDMVATLKLKALGASLDILTPDQIEYMNACN